LKETKIVSFSLICMILLSSVSFAYGAVDSKFVYIKNENMFDSNIHQTSFEFIKPNNFVINLQDGIDVKLAGDGRNRNDIPIHHVVNLYDSTSAHVGLGLPYEKLNERAKIISVNLNDGIKASSPTNDDEKTFVIKNNAHRQTTWEGIFPLDRPKNNTKSVYKTIQDDIVMKIQFRGEKKIRPKNMTSPVRACIPSINV